jgi:hypothetical protein
MPLTVPPVPRDPAFLDQLASIFSTVSGERAFWYVSAPLTSGSLFSKWSDRLKVWAVDSPEYEDLLRAHVIEPNRNAAKTVVKRLRESSATLVIEPTALDDIPGWTQDDFLYFWSRVISTYVEKVVFLEGWQYSSGCSYEFLVAIQADLETFEEHLEPLTVERAKDLLADAVRSETAKGLSPRVQEYVLAALVQPSEHARG